MSEYRGILGILLAGAEAARLDDYAARLSDPDVRGGLALHAELAEFLRELRRSLRAPTSAKLYATADGWIVGVTNGELREQWVSPHFLRRAVWHRQARSGAL